LTSGIWREFAPLHKHFGVEETAADRPPSKVELTLAFLGASVFPMTLAISDAFDAIKAHGALATGFSTVIAAALLALGAIVRGQRPRRTSVVALILVTVAASAGFVIAIRAPACGRAAISAKVVVPYTEFDVTTFVQCAESDGASTVIVTTVREGADRHVTYYVKRAAPIDRSRVTTPIDVDTNAPDVSRRFLLVRLTTDDWIALAALEHRTQGSTGVWGSDAEAMFSGHSHLLAVTPVVTPS
jgi:hypothetical protein